MYPWKTQLPFERKSATPVYMQLVNEFIRQVSSGQLQSGHKVPGSRALASLLGLNRKTVIQMYDELLAQGWLEIIPSSGTYISRELPLVRWRELPTGGITHESHEVSYRKFEYIRTPESGINDRIVINDGSPDPRLAPMDWIYRECRSIAARQEKNYILSYGSIMGDELLRGCLAEYLGVTRGLQIGRENILITRGSQMGIYLLTQALVRTGDHVVVGETGYDAAEWCIRQAGGHLVRIPVDENGLQVGLLERICETTPIRSVYITPHHHFPTTVTLSSDRRLQLLQLALRYDFSILEDDYDYDFHYNSSPIVPLASIHHGSHVAYVGSFSKIFAPAIRVGYVVASENLIRQLGRLRRIVDRQGDAVLEHVMARAIITGELQRHLKKVLKIYESRRDYFCEWLGAELGDEVRFTIPEGGMAVWTCFRKDLREVSAAAHSFGLGLVVEKRYAEKTNCLRLGFASLEREEMQQAIALLKKAVYAGRGVTR